MSTLTPANALAYIRKFVRDVPVTSIDSQVCHIINSIMWSFYPWSWSQSNLTAVPLVDGQQDYTLTETNILRLLRARIVRTDTTPDEYRDPMDIRRHIEPSLRPIGYTQIEECAIEPVSGKLRLQSAAYVGTETLQIQGEYQRNPTLIDDAALTVAFAFPDTHFGVFCEGLKWKLYEMVGDKRAGTASVTKDGRQVYTGQLGVFMGLLAQMASVEDYGDEDTITPESPLGAQMSYGR